MLFTQTVGQWAGDACRRSLALQGSPLPPSPSPFLHILLPCPFPSAGGGRGSDRTQAVPSGLSYCSSLGASDRTQALATMFMATVILSPRGLRSTPQPELWPRYPDAVGPGTPSRRDPIEHPKAGTTEWAVYQALGVALFHELFFLHQ